MYIYSEEAAGEGCGTVFRAVGLLIGSLVKFPPPHRHGSRADSRQLQLALAAGALHASQCKLKVGSSGGVEWLHWLAPSFQC